jgi:hypothetical protein
VVPAAVSDAVAEAVHPDGIAIMLYGSHARGESTPDSDVDILQLVATAPRSYSHGRINVTQYTAAHICTMAASGSLFVLHLRSEGVVLNDRLGVLQRCLDAYVPPGDYEPLKRQIARISSCLDPVATDLHRYLPGLFRLGIYLLRTALYIRYAEQGAPEFDLGRIRDQLRDPELSRILSKRRLHAASATAQDVSEVYWVLKAYLPEIGRNEFQTVEGVAVALSDDPHARVLLGHLLAGDAFEYTELVAAPL